MSLCADDVKQEGLAVNLPLSTPSGGTMTMQSCQDCFNLVFFVHAILISHHFQCARQARDHEARRCRCVDCMPARGMDPCSLAQSRCAHSYKHTRTFSLLLSADGQVFSKITSAAHFQRADQKLVWSSMNLFMSIYIVTFSKSW